MKSKNDIDFGFLTKGSFHRTKNENIGEIKIANDCELFSIPGLEAEM